MLGAYDFMYMPRIAIKGQVLADFVAKFTKDAANRGKETMGVVTTLACVIPSWDCVGNPREAGNRKITAAGFSRYQQQG